MQLTLWQGVEGSAVSTVWSLEQVASRLELAFAKHRQKRYLMATREAIWPARGAWPSAQLCSKRTPPQPQWQQFR
eukprot:6379743-Amphidinium_carterae.1